MASQSMNVYKQTESNDAPPNTNVIDLSGTPNRRVLGDVSPNVRKTSPAAALLTRKPLTGSPLKRSFNATLESGEGLTYLKKRKLSDDEVLSEVNDQHKRAPGWEHGLDGTTTFRAFLQPDGNDDDTTHSIAVPRREGSPTEPNTPSEDDNAEHSSAERKSFSSLINYDPSSQQQASNVLLHGVSRAEMLRLRLRIAMYKVRTNQTNVPFAKLRLEPKDSATAASMRRSEAVEEAVAVLRREAQQQQALARQQQKDSAASPSIPKLLPGPTLRPTAYSSRMICEQPSSISSSPPSGASPDHLLPVAPPSRMLSTPQRGAGSRISHGFPGAVEMFPEPSEQELTSSVVKGRVAEGLLGLRNAV